VAFDDALRRVREGGGRLTRARRDLLAALHAESGRITAEELAARHPDIDLATVYRALALFEEVGVIEHVHLGHGPASYRWNGERTVAAVCEVCESVTELPASELDDLAARLRDEHGLRLSVGHFALSVRCAHCTPTP
jgi:Fur family transcriptional regulator, ferric uptake regulator